MARIAPTLKSVVGRLQPITEVTEPELLSALPTPWLASARAEAVPLSSTVCRIRSRVETVTKCLEARQLDASKARIFNFRPKP